MSNETFVYVTYIATTPAQVWKALLEGEITRQYWGGHENVPESGWKQGSQWRHVAGDGKGTVRHIGEVLEIVPSKRLVLSWANPENAGNKSLTTRVALDLETVGEMVKLTVTHDQLYPEMGRAIGMGWPLVLCSLKSFLETGRPLDIWSGSSRPCAATQS